MSIINFHVLSSCFGIGYWLLVNAIHSSQTHISSHVQLMIVLICHIFGIIVCTGQLHRVSIYRSYLSIVANSICCAYGFLLIYAITDRYHLLIFSILLFVYSLCSFRMIRSGNNTTLLMQFAAAVYCIVWICTQENTFTYFDTLPVVSGTFALIGCCLLRFSPNLLHTSTSESDNVRKYMTFIPLIAIDILTIYFKPWYPVLVIDIYSRFYSSTISVLDISTLTLQSLLVLISILHHFYDVYQTFHIIFHISHPRQHKHVSTNITEILMIYLSICMVSAALLWNLSFTSHAYVLFSCGCIIYCLYALARIMCPVHDRHEYDAIQ